MAEKHNRAAEDVVEYSVFPEIQSDKNGHELQVLLEELATSYLTFLSPLLIDVIWQNEGFNLSPVAEEESVPAHIKGQTNFGDNVEDEWFIVYLLFQLTKQFPGLVVKVWDNDEEFLLIEAANSLPKWLNPETSENRVYIYDGELHIIPTPQSPADIAAFPQTITSIGDAVECIRTYADKTRASKNVQNAILNRIKNFPEQMTENTHYSHCYIPASMAAILDERPQLIAPVVQAFYYRDPIDLKCCRTFQYFRPGTRVMHRTRFTRCLYAQLIHQSFQPDRRSGWIMPSSSNPKFKSHDLGMKLAHGFEILCHKSADDYVVTDTGQTIGTSDVRWQRYLQSLKDKNFFRGELEGSVLYQELLENAKKFYLENMTKGKRTETAGTQILGYLQTLPVDIEERRRAESTLQQPDDDDWLNLTPASLDSLMKERGGLDGETDDVFDLGKVSDSIKTFVNKVSNVEGAEIPGVDVEDEDDADIQFDGSGFITAMQEMFEFEDSGTDSSSDMDEYGWNDDSDGGEKKSKHGKSKIKRPPSLDQYMDIMDRELAKTEVGKSFEKQTKPQKKGSVKSSPVKKKPVNKDIDEEDDDFQPVDIDLNTVKNMLESYGAQDGLSGPASNILGSMGVVIPPNMDKLDNSESVSQEARLNNGQGQQANKPSRTEVSNNQEGKIEANERNVPSKVKPANRPPPPPRPNPAQRAAPRSKPPSRPTATPPNRPTATPPNRPKATPPDRPARPTATPPDRPARPPRPAQSPGKGRQRLASKETEI